MRDSTKKVQFEFSNATYKEIEKHKKRLKTQTNNKLIYETVILLREAVAEVLEGRSICSINESESVGIMELVMPLLNEMLLSVKDTDEKRKDRRDIFLCHSNKDKKFVRRLARDLHEFAVISWFDEWELAPGDSLHESIGRALEGVSFIGVIISPNSVSSNWCKKELNQALSKESRTGKKLVLPLLYKKTKIPSFLEDKLYIEFENSYEIGLVKLVAFIHELDQTQIMKYLNNKILTNLQDIKLLLEEAVGWKNTISFGEKDWNLLKALLNKHDINIGDTFSIIGPDGIHSHIK